MTKVDELPRLDHKSSLSTEAQYVEKPVLGANATKEDIFYKGVLDEEGVIAAPIDPVAEKKLLRKIDLHLIPILWLLFLCAFIGLCHEKVPACSRANVRQIVSISVMLESKVLNAICEWSLVTTTCESLAAYQEEC